MALASPINPLIASRSIAILAIALALAATAELRALSGPLFEKRGGDITGGGGGFGGRSGHGSEVGEGGEEEGEGCGELHVGFGLVGETELEVKRDGSGCEDGLLVLVLVGEGDESLRMEMTGCFGRALYIPVDNQPQELSMNSSL